MLPLLYPPCYLHGECPENSGLQHRCDFWAWLMTVVNLPKFSYVTTHISFRDKKIQNVLSPPPNLCLSHSPWRCLWDSGKFCFPDSKVSGSLGPLVLPLVSDLLGLCEDTESHRPFQAHLCLIFPRPHEKDPMLRDPPNPRGRLVSPVIWLGGRPILEVAATPALGTTARWETRSRQ